MTAHKHGKYNYRIPHGITEIESYYGAPTQPRCHAGLVVLPEPIGSTSMLSCHELAVDAIEAFFGELKKRDLLKLVKSIGRVYIETMREQVYPPQMSLHCWGCAITINYPQNLPGSVYGQPGPEPTEYLHRTHPIVECARELGIVWGGDLEIPEPAEFLLATGY